MCAKTKLAAVLALLVCAPALKAQRVDPLSVRSRDRIQRAIDDGDTVALRGNVHPLALPEFDSGPVDPEMRMERMILTLEPDAQQKHALEDLLAAQHDPGSPLFHHWLTPLEFGEHFGVSQNDARRVAQWLTRRGFSVEPLPADRRTIIFSGTAAQVHATFRTEIRQFKRGNELHHANATDPEIPAALAQVVGGIVSLHDFPRRSMHAPARPLGRTPAPEWTNGTYHYVTPQDMATIYNINPLYTAGDDGTGQTIAIVGRTNIDPSDVAMFRSTFGLPSNPPVIVLNGSDPGITSWNEESEADLDVEWSGAVAKNATVKFVVSASTQSSDGVDLSAQYIVSNNVAPVMSTSFGLCEAAIGVSGMNFYSSLWQQAAAQGITTMISSGDAGAAGCDSPGASSGSQQGVNGLCSSPYSVCVGGTMFNEGAGSLTFWNSTNTPYKGSAASYIPEAVWNESGSNGGGGLVGTGGGASIIFSKPAWQTGPGVPADGKRDVPDISLTASFHDAYVLVQNQSIFIISGTSASSPAFTGIMSLVNQVTGAAQGNANPRIYALSAAQAAGGTAVYHRVTVGNNTVPGVAGFNAGPNYTQATGVGSVDAYLFANNFAAGGSTGLALATSGNTASVSAASTGSVGVTLSVSNGFSAPVTLSVSGLPTGVTASYSPASLAAPGSGSSLLTFSASANAPSTSATVTITATGGGQTRTASVALSVTAAAASISFTKLGAAVSVQQGGAYTVSVSSQPLRGFNSAVAISVAGLPTGVTAVVSKPTISAPGSGASGIALSVGSSVATGGYTFTATASGGGVTQTLSIPFTVTPKNGCTVTTTLNQINIIQGNSVGTSVSCTNAVGLTAPLTLAVSNLSRGISATFAQPTIAPGTGRTVLSFTASPTATQCLNYVTVTATSGSVVQTLVLPMVVNAPSIFSLSTTSTTLNLVQGASGTVTYTSTTSGGFNAAVAFSATGLPTGLTASFSPSTLSAPGSGTTALTVTAASNLAPGTYSFLAGGVSGSQTSRIKITVNVTLAPNFSLSSANPGVYIVQGNSGAYPVASTVVGGFNSAVALSVSGAPAGVTATIASSTISAPGSGTRSVAIAVAGSVTTGPYTLTITATGGGLTRTLPFTLTVNPPPTFNLSGPPSVSLVVARGYSASVTVKTTAPGSFSSPVALSTSGLPSGVTASFSPSTITSASAGTTTLTFTAASNATSGLANVTVTATGGGTTRTMTVALNVR